MTEDVWGKCGLGTLVSRTSDSISSWIKLSLSAASVSVSTWNHAYWEVHVCFVSWPEALCFSQRRVHGGESWRSLMNQEVLTPGQLFLMFLKVSAGCFTLEHRNLLWDGVAIFSSIVSCMLIISSLTLCFIFLLFFVCLAVRDLIRGLSLHGRFRTFFSIFFRR